MAKKAKSAAKFDLPSMLAMQRCLNVSDGLMYSIIPTPDEDKDGKEGSHRLEPVTVIRHGIRGVLSASNEDTNATGNGLSNIQITETAKLAPNAIGLAVKCVIRTTPIEQSLFACNDAKYAETLTKLVKTLQYSESLAEVCRRYARNILNGRWLWRNLVLGRPVVTVEYDDGEDSDSGDSGDKRGENLPRKHFDAYTNAEKRLGEYLLNCLSGQPEFGEIRITAEIKGGDFGLLEVFPSQNYFQRSQNLKGFARSLYKVKPITSALLEKMSRNTNPSLVTDIIPMGIAALRDQKIGNAIRTIDTWHDSDTPIAIEPNGASLSDHGFHRPPGQGKSAYDLLGKQIESMAVLAEQNQGTADEQLMYLSAILVRGGVFSEGSAGKEKGEAQEAGSGSGSGD